MSQSKVVWTNIFAKIEQILCKHWTNMENWASEDNLALWWKTTAAATLRERQEASPKRILKETFKKEYLLVFENGKNWNHLSCDFLT